MKRQELLDYLQSVALETQREDEITATEYSEALNITNEAGRNRLKALVEQGILTSRKSGGRVYYSKIEDL